MTCLNQIGKQLEDFRQRFALKNFVETGCFAGDGLLVAKEIGFGRLYSCDVKEDHVTEVRKRIPSADVRLSKSVDFLRNVILELKGPTLFWLDAHYPKHYGMHDLDGPKNPLKEELVALAAKSGIEGDVILADDIRVIRDPENPVYNPALEEDIEGQQSGYFVETRYTLRELTETLSNSHSSEVWQVDTGVLVFTPLEVSGPT